MKKKNLYKMSKLSDNLSAMLAHLYHRSFLMLSIVFCLIINIGNVNAQSCSTPYIESQFLNSNGTTASFDLTIGWQPVPVTFEYRYREASKCPTCWEPNPPYFPSGNSTTINLNGLKPGTDYIFLYWGKCSPTNTSGQTSHPFSTPPSYTQLCGAPTGLTFDSQFSTDYSSSFRFTSNSIHQRNFIVSYSNPDGSNPKTKTLFFPPGTGASKIFELKKSEGLVAGQTYKVKIRSSESACGNSAPFSSQITFTVKATCVTPTNFTCTSKGEKTATLKFTVPANTPTNYQISYTHDASFSGFTETKFLWTGATCPYSSCYQTVVMNNLIPNTNYHFKVRSGSNILCQWSNVCDFKTDPPPCKVPIVSYSYIALKDRVTINFSIQQYQNPTSFTGWYQIVGTNSWTPSGGGTWPNTSTTNINKSVTITGLSAGKQYFFKMRANCSNGSSQESSRINFSTPNYKTPYTEGENQGVLFFEDSTQNEVLINEEELLSMQNELIENLSIIPFPNPIMAGEELQLDGLLEGASVSIYSLNGQLVLSEIFVDENQQKIKIPADLPAAIYLIKLTTLSGEVLFKKLAVTNTN
jgi:hypothetical protein